MEIANKLPKMLEEFKKEFPDIAIENKLVLNLFVLWVQQNYTKLSNLQVCRSHCPNNPCLINAAWLCRKNPCYIEKAI